MYKTFYISANLHSAWVVGGYSCCFGSEYSHLRGKSRRPQEGETPITIVHVY